MNNENDLYLAHYGVLGMKWGKRKAQQKEKYGYTKRELKKKIKETKRTYRREENPYHTFDGSTGKNWNKVRDAHKKAVDRDEEVKKLRGKRDSMYKSAEIADAFGKSDWSERLQATGDSFADDIDTRSREIGKRYYTKYQDALLKDIGYKDLELGRRMLNEYGIENDWGKHKGS